MRDHPGRKETQKKMPPIIPLLERRDRSRPLLRILCRAILVQPGLVSVRLGKRKKRDIPQKGKEPCCCSLR